MPISTQNLVLAPDAYIDLQLHTVLSDGKWTAPALLDHLQAEGFGLAAITDHERVDTASELQALAQERNFPLLVAAEMSGLWKGELTDFLCFGFPLGESPLNDLALATSRRQYENTRHIFEQLQKEGYAFQESELSAMLAKPAAEQVNELVALVTKYHHGEKSVGRTLLEAGFDYQTNPPSVIVEAAHQSGALRILAHGGRTDGFVTYDAALLDELRAEAPIDGIEAYYPLHTPEQTALYLDYAAQHDLLVSAGSDSHSPAKPPIKYRAETCRKLLERLGIELKA